MSDLLGLLGLAGVAGAKAQTATLEGQDIKRQREQKDLLASLERDRRMAQDAEETKRNDLLNRLTQTQIDKANAPAPAPTRRTQVVDGQLVDLDTGEAKPIAGYKAPPKQAPTPAAGSYTQFTGPDGQPVFFNPQTGATVKAPAGFQPPSTRAGLPTVEERKAAAFYKAGKFGYDSLERIIGGDDPSTPEIEEKAGKEVPGFLASVGQRIGMGGGNLMTSDQVRQMRQSGLMLSDAWLRYTSGAAVPEQEVGRFAESFLPRAGDDKGTLALKAEARQVIIDAIRDGAGRALNTADDAQFTAAMEKIGRLDPDAAALMQKIRMRMGTQPTAADMPGDLDAMINAELGRQP